MPRFTLRQEIAAGFAAMICSVIFVVTAVSPGINAGITVI